MLNLIDRLKKEHLFIIDLVNETRRAGVDSKQGQDIFLSLRDYLLPHLKKEDEEFYPLLKKAVGKEKDLEEIVNIFSRDFIEISQLCHQFFKKYPKGCLDEKCVRDFEDFFSVLKQRMRREEIVLFTAGKMLSSLEYLYS